MRIGREFKEFILRGNVVDLAIGIVIGIAFGAVVMAFVSDILMPLISIPGKISFANYYVQIGGGKFLIGHFLNTVISFLLVAAAVFFFVVKPVNALMASRRKKTSATTRDCPYCVQSVPLQAARCPYCTSDLEPIPAPAEPTLVEASPQERERRVRERYGGFSWSATFIGFAVASFLTLVFLAIVGAIVGGIGYQMGAGAPVVGGALSTTSKDLGIGGLGGAFIAVALAYSIGGYTAGRMARFDGVKNGLGVVLWTIAVGIILGSTGAVIAARVNLISHLHLPSAMPMVTTSGVLSGLAIALLVMLPASALGGRRGEAYHRKIDRDAGLLEQRPAA